MAMSTSSCTAQTIRVLIDGTFQEFTSYLENHVQQYQQLHPETTIQLLLADDLEETLLGSTWDASIFPAQLIGTLIEADRLWDLSSFVQVSSQLQWTEALPFLRGPAANYGAQEPESSKASSSSSSTSSSSTSASDTGGRPYLIPLDGDILSMFYRKDLFDQYNRTVPRTWEEYWQEAAFFHDMPKGPEGSAIAGSCVSRLDNCGNAYWTQLILASMTQTHGTASGFFLDPNTLDPMFGPAMQEALRLSKKQMEYGHDQELTGECLESNFDINAGNCALTYNWGNQLVVMGEDYDIGVAPTPGSTSVWSRTQRRLVPCDSATCPHADYYDDIGFVNRAPYAAFGGWAAAVNNLGESNNKYASADFLAFLSNSQQSLQDVLPNTRSAFSQPYRYSHIDATAWTQDAGFDSGLATDYTETLRKQWQSENMALEMRISAAYSMRAVVDEEVFDYLTQSLDASEDEELALRIQATETMEQRIHDLIVSRDRLSPVSRVADSYRDSLGYTFYTDQELHRYINEDFRDAAFGLSGLMCVTAFTLMIWTIRHRNNHVMKAFQPALLVQSAVGLLLLSSSIIPLGFDDTWYDDHILDITCMLSPWLYVVGYSLFFTSVYAKIRECIKIYKEPRAHDVLLVAPKSALRLLTRVLILNGTMMGLWTGLDPLKWERKEVDGGIVAMDGTVETYGSCQGGSTALGFAVALFATNLLITIIATTQAFKCRFLVLEYNEMQWLPLIFFPFVEVWVIGAPILLLIEQSPTITFVTMTMMVASSTVVAGMAVFAPKDWYIRKFYHSDEPPRPGKGFPQRTGSAGVLVLQHPTVESQKQIEELSFKLEQMEGWNTELEIEIRVIRDKYRELSANGKDNPQGNQLRTARSEDSPDFRSSTRGLEEYEQTEISQSNDDELFAVQQFQQVWTAPEEDEEEYGDTGRSPHVDNAEGSERSTGLARSTRSVGIESAPGISKSDRSLGQSPRASGTASPEPEDPLVRLMRLAEDDSTGNFEHHTPESAEDEGPRDPLALIAMMGDDDDDEDYGGPPELSADGFVAPVVEDEDSRSGPRDPLEVLGGSDDEDSDDGGMPGKESAQDIIARIVALKMALADKGETEEDNKSTNSNPEDPLARIMMMVAEAEAQEEAELAGAPNVEYLFEGDDDDEADKSIIRKKELRELSTMIKDNDLRELERRAARLAEALKEKLATSNLADLSKETNSSTESENDTGYLFLAKGHKDASAQSGMTGLDISKISDDGDKRFVSMSDSILDSPSKYNGTDGAKGRLLSPLRNDSSHERVGESSADFNLLHRHSSLASGSSNSDDGPVTQLAGEPSRGEGDARFGVSDNWKKDMVSIDGLPRASEMASPGNFRRSPTMEDSFQNKSYSISDWVAVGGIAGALMDWSDSQSTSSYADSVQDSVTSFEATTRASALETPIASELDNLVGHMDWDGVALAAKQYETPEKSRINSSQAPGTTESGLSTLEEKRRKKREIEAWRSSLARSFEKAV
eukprot:Nitzschia sp. Nitz4//scaffold183_size43938//16402//20956//NITZ4_007269-RA/size43938-augustus-gene-0.74-mRNA-1//-1//CDS//3329539611//6870//frame0